MRRIRPVLLAALPLAAFACSGDPALRDPARTPLFDGRHAPDLLVESTAIALPPSLSGNRFLRGFFPWRDGGRIVLAPQVDARIEVAQLAARERRLILDLHDPEVAGAAGSSLRVRVAGRELGPFAWRDPLEIPLPRDLPLGRAAIDVVPAGGAAPGIVGAALRPALPAGDLRLERGDLVQSGDSRAEVTVRITDEVALAGSFEPPVQPAAGQRFRLTLEREDGSSIRRFDWSPSLWNRFRGTRSFRLPLRGTTGLVTVRFEASGPGPTARWHDLAWLRPRGTPPAPPAQDLAPGPPPQLVVVYVMDALRADRVGFWGGPSGISPTIDRLANGGLAALRHRAVAPNTLPSTKTLFTGRAFLSRGGWKLGTEDGTTLAEGFARAGYRTGLFSGNVYVSPAYGTDRGFEHHAPEVLVDGVTARAPSPINDNAAHVHAAALAWLKGLPPGAKAFLYLHVIHPHNPYAPPEPFRSTWATARSPLDGSSATLTGIKLGRIAVDGAGRDRLRGLYAGGLAYADAELGRFLGDLSTIVPADRTLVALTSDHGEELFDHGGVLHGYTLHEEQLRIPLALVWSGRLRPATIEEPTDTRDLHATLVDACALTGADRHPLPSEGRSLLRRPLPVAEGEPLHFAAASSVKGGIYAVQSARWKLIWAPRSGLGWGQGEGAGRARDPEVLYDLTSDPGESRNLVGQTGAEISWLRSRLLAWIERALPDEGGEPAVDRETVDRLRALGYVN